MSNSSSVEHTISRDDLLIESTFLYWWTRRWFIAAVIAGAAILFAGIVLLIPKSYRAQASVIIMPPRFVPEVRTQPLTVTTAQRLLETHELYQQVVTQLQRNRYLLTRMTGETNPNKPALEETAALTAQEIASATGASQQEAEALAEMQFTELQGLIEFSDDDLQDMTVDTVAEMLYSEESVEKKTASDLTYSPVLQLFAVSDTGSKAQVLVNTWARLFEQKYESVTRGQTQRLYESLESQQTEGQQELESIQKVLVEFKLQNNLELLERQIGEYTASMTSYSRQLVVRSNELVSMKAEMQTLVQLVSALEQTEGGWIGGVQVDVLSTSSDSLAYSSMPEVNTDDSVPTITLMRREALRSRADLIRAMTLARTFQQQTPLDFLQAEEKRLQKEYLKQVTDYNKSLVKADVLQNTLQEIVGRLAETSQSVVVATSLPEDVVGQAALSGASNGLRRAAEIQFHREQLNPLWKELVDQQAKVSRQLAEARATIEELSASLPEKEKEVLTLGQRVYQAAQSEKIVDQRLNRYDKLNENLFEHYTHMKNQLFNVSWRVTLLEEEINSLRTGLAATREDLEAYRLEYEAASAQVEILNLRKSAIEERANLLTKKLQESLVAVGEQVSDVTIASKAVAPSRHFFPPRTLLLALMTLLTASILLFGMSRRRYMELASARDYSAG